MKKVFVLKNTVVSFGVSHSSDAVIGCSIPDVVAYELPNDSEIGIGYTRDESTGEFVAPLPQAPKVGPIHFQMLFTPEEIVAAEELKATDKKLAAFWKLIDDPRTDTVDLSLQTVQSAVEYTLTVVKNAGVDLDVPGRKEEICSGIIK